MMVALPVLLATAAISCGEGGPSDAVNTTVTEIEMTVQTASFWSAGISLASVGLPIDSDLNDQMVRGCASLPQRGTHPDLWPRQYSALRYQTELICETVQETARQTNSSLEAVLRVLAPAFADLGDDLEALPDYSHSQLTHAIADRE